MTSSSSSSSSRLNDWLPSSVSSISTTTLVSTGILTVSAFVGGFLISRYMERKAHKFDLVDMLLDHTNGGTSSSSLHHNHTNISTATASVLHHSGSGASSPATSSPHLLSTPTRVSSKTVRYPDSAYPTGSAVVAPSEFADPTGNRRKLSLEHHRNGGAIIVGVGGPSGSGKTSIATLIAERLSGIRVSSISCDSYYKSLDSHSDPTNYNFDHPSAIDFDLLATHLQALRQGHEVDIPEYSFKTHKRLDSTVRISGQRTDVVILDGIFVLWSDAIREQCDLTIFTAEDLDICLARRLKRDLVERGRTVENVLQQYVRFVRVGYHQFVAPSMTLADFIIPRAKENETAIQMLARDIERRVDWG